MTTKEDTKQTEEPTATTDLHMDEPPEDFQEELMENIIAALRMVFDPEIPVNVYDLGLIYDVRIDDIGNVEVDMTLTTPGCPVAQTFPETIRAAVESVDCVVQAQVEVVWDPPWTQDMMGEAAKLQLGLL